MIFPVLIYTNAMHYEHMQDMLHVHNFEALKFRE